ncbi:hypothetical protein M9435_005477 [Picochlorum sp. BPE23]|nr:hypothetical protein M9435_005477 [Picochlorum sp. BPE23]
MTAGVETTSNNAWVESYLNALLTFGLSGEYASETSDSRGPNADRNVYSRYYVRSLLNLDEEALKNAWSKAVSSTKSPYGGEKDARLEYLSWRIWHLKRKQATSEAEPEILEPDAGSDEDSSDEDDVAVHEGKNLPTSNKSVPNKTLSSHVSSEEGIPKKSLSIKTKPDHVSGTADIDAMVEEYIMSPKQDATPLAHQTSSENKLDRLYIVMISLHGLVRGENMELGRDSDTGGQVKYVVELAKAMSLHPAVFRVDLLTRMIKDPIVHSDYGVAEECLTKGNGELGGSYIVRLPCGPTHKYIPKEQLWPHVREFADRGIVHINKMLNKLAESGRRCELYCIHGHYADAGETAVLIASSLGVPQITTGHSLGRNKLEHLLSSGGLNRSEIEASYNISRRIEAEERCLDVATMVFTSTQQEVDEQWGLYNGYNSKLAKVVRFRRSQGRHMPYMKVSPPGLDFSNLKVNIPEDPVVKEFVARRAELAEREMMPFSPSENRRVSSPVDITGSQPMPQSKPDDAVHSLKSPENPGSLSSSLAEINQVQRPADIIPNRPAIWQEIARFLRNPVKPAILAMSRPDAKKNITTLVEAFGKHSMLRELANLVLIMGNRDNIDSMASGSQKILTQVLKLIDAHDLYGSVAYPKHHGQSDISDIYLFAADTRGVFVNIALQEPFGLTVIEAAAHGVPTVATCNGGPVDIMATLHHGVVVDPTDSDVVAEALLSILTSQDTWDTMSTNGVNNIMAYSWPAHCKRYMESMDAEYAHFNPSVDSGRSYSGMMRKRLSRLDLLGIVDMDMPQSPHEGAELRSALSTPRDTPLLSGQVSPRNLNRNASGFTQDDINVIKSMEMEAALSSLADESPGAQKYVVICLDRDGAGEHVASCIKQIQEKFEEKGINKFTGIGVMSMLGFETSHSLLKKYGVDVDNISFIICNSGADIWLQQGGEWLAKDEYESLIDYSWDRNSFHRMLKKIISSPSENSQRLPRLKELLYNVGEEQESGVHPRHICLELDPETQNILASGMGPKAKTTEHLRLTGLIAARLKNKLRSKGFRANFTLQIVPEEKERNLAALHITPVRSSRPLALRWLANKLNLNMSDFTSVVFPAYMKGGECLESVMVPWTSDASDLVGGLQKCEIIVDESLGVLGGDEKRLRGLDDALGLPLWPYSEVQRVHVSKGIKQGIDSLIHMVLSQDQVV